LANEAIQAEEKIKFKKSKKGPESTRRCTYGENTELYGGLQIGSWITYQFWLKKP
jgi:hypothetical protein